MLKSSLFRLVTVALIVVCIIWVGYRQVVEFQKTHISQESDLPTIQHFILFYANLYQEKNPSLYILNIDTGKVSTWNAIDRFVPNTIRLISWSDKNQELLMTGSLQGVDVVNQLYAVKSNGIYVKIAQETVPMVWEPDDKRLVKFNNPHTMLGATISPNGKWLAFSWCPPDQHCAVYLTDPNGKNLQKLIGGFAPSLHSVQWSPDNSKIAFVEFRGALPSMLWVMNSDGTSAMPIVETQGDFAWSPDSNKIAFTSKKDGYEYTFIAAGGKHMGMEFTAYTHSIYMIDLTTKEIQRMTYLRQLATQILWAK